MTKFRSLHEHLIELMELSRRMYGGEGKDAFHVTFLCFMSIMLPSQSAIPFVLARAYKEHMFYMHLALLLSWLVTGLIVTISILVWLLKPVKEVRSERACSGPFKACLDRKVEDHSAPLEAPQSSHK